MLKYKIMENAYSAVVKCVNYDERVPGFKSKDFQNR